MNAPTRQQAEIVRDRIGDAMGYLVRLRKRMRIPAGWIVYKGMSCRN
jgi:hypothetical protein